MCVLWLHMEGIRSLVMMLNPTLAAAEGLVTGRVVAGEFALVGEEGNRYP